MTHYWRIHRWLPERFGQLCRILVCKKGKVLLQFTDGFRVVSTIHSLRKRKET
jgi:hypothetical protein